MFCDDEFELFSGQLLLIYGLHLLYARRVRVFWYYFCALLRCAWANTEPSTNRYGKVCMFLFSLGQSSLFHLHVNGWQLHFSLTTLSATDQRIRILNAKFQRRYNDDGKTHRMTFIDNINKLLHTTAVFKFTQPIFEIGISMDAAKMPTICLPNC